MVVPLSCGSLKAAVAAGGHLIFGFHALGQETVVKI